MKKITFFVISMIITLWGFNAFASQNDIFIEQDNLIMGGDFSQDTGYWSNGYNDLVSLDSTGGADGSPCAKIMGSGELIQTMPAFNKDIVSGKKYLISANVRATDNGTAQLSVQYNDGDSTRYTISGEIAVTTEWITIWGIFEYENGEGNPDFKLSVYGDAEFYIDDVLVMEIVENALTYNLEMREEAESKISIYNDLEEKSLLLTFVCYQGSKLCDIEAENFDISKNYFEQKSLKINITDKNKDGDLKLLFWQGNLNPLCDKRDFSVTKQNIEFSNKQATEAKTSDAVMLLLNNNIAYSRSNQADEAVKPLEIDGTVLIPVEWVAGELTMMAEWDNEENICTVYNAYYELKFEINKAIAEVFDFTTREAKNINLSAKTCKIDSTTYFPLKAFCEVFEKEYLVTDDGLILISDNEITLSDNEKADALNFFKEEIETINLYVALNGNDNNDGSENSPFKTLDKAKLEARKYPDENVVINIEEGEYELSEALVFDNNDSKTGLARTTFKGHGDVIINGGMIAKRWEKCEAINGVTGIYRHKLEAFRDYQVIYEDGKMSVPARYPNRDENNITGSYLYAEQEEFDTTSEGPKKSFLYGEDFPKLKRSEGVSVWIWPGGNEGYIRWFLDEHKIESIDEQNKKITLTTEARYTIGPTSAYYVSNDMNLLDAPGEFYVNEDEGYYYLYYVPRNAENIENNIVLPSTETIIKIWGEDNKPIKGISFENLSVRNSDYDAKLAMIDLRNTRNITFAGCRIYSSGGSAMKIQKYGQNNIIRNCEIFDTGDAAIFFSSARGIYTHKNKYNRIENNHIYNVGLIVKNTTAVNLNHSSNNTVKYNTLHNSPRYLISTSDTARDETKYTEDLSNIEGKNCLIAFNDVSNGPTESQDGAIIGGYMSKRVLTISNYIHNVNSINNLNSPGLQSEGLYNDDCTSGFVTRYNLIADLQKNIPGGEEAGRLNTALRQKGAGSLIENNFIVASHIDNAVYGGDPISDGRPLGNYYFNNISYTDNTAPIHSVILNTGNELTITKMDNNIYYNRGGVYKLTNPTIKDLADLRAYGGLELDKNSLTEDPKFVDYENGDYRLRYDSPAYRLGIKDLNMAEIGVRADFKYANDEEEIERLYVRFDGDTRDKSFRRMYAGQSIKLTPTVRTKTGFVANLDNADISYVSNNAAVATVNESGIITADSVGMAEITVTVTKNGKTLMLPVTVIVDEKNN